ncbi:MAG: methylmalonyl-CoA epimerase [Bdellovibrionales bacterium]
MDPFSNSSEFKLDHIGIAVQNLEQGAAFYKALGFLGMHIEVVPTEKVKVGMFELANQARVELLEPVTPDSAVGKFLEKRGPGIHHICFKVKDIRSIMRRLEEAGMQLINKEPTPGAHNCLVAFVHPKSTGGVLIELSESQAQGDD